MEIDAGHDKLEGECCSKSKVKSKNSKVKIQKMKAVRYILIMVVLVLGPVLLQAQPSDPQDAAGVPIDGGLSVLLAAGAGYGVKKIRESRKKAFRK